MFLKAFKRKKSLKGAKSKVKLFFNKELQMLIQRTQLLIKTN